MLFFYDKNLSKPPIILTIAGSDSGAGAGVQGDLKTISALGGYAVSAITCITSQNTKGIQSVYSLPANAVSSQLKSIASDFKLDAIKIGMLFDEQNVNLVDKFLDDLNITNVVLDPIISSTSGYELCDKNTINLIVEKLFCRSKVITPNLPEVISILEILGERKLKNLIIETLADDHKKLIYLLKKCSKVFFAFGKTALFIKGGHMFDWKSINKNDSRQIFDLFLYDGNVVTLQKEFIITKNTHGTGCSLSSAIATFLALGDNLEQAVIKAQNFIHKCIYFGKNSRIGSGNGPINHFFTESF